MARLGADVDQMDALASFFDSAATTLEGHAGTIDGQIRAIWWRGSIADLFTAAWASADRKRLTTTATALHDIAKRVRHNAAQQRAASGDIAGIGAMLGAKLYEIAGAVTDFLGGFDSRTPEEIAAWWRSLSEEERRQAVASNPDLGNGENVPVQVRYEANWIAADAGRQELAAQIEAWEAELTDADGLRADVLRSLIEDGRAMEATAWRLLYVHDQDGNVVVGEDGEWVRQQILYADLSNGEIAVVNGTLEGADEVLITTPGTGSDIHKFSSNFAPEAEILAQDGRAVISTFVWDPPGSLPANALIDNYAKTIVEGGMDNIVRTAAANSEIVISVSHSAGTDGMRYYAEHSDGADLIDGYVMLAAPNPEAAPEAIGNKPIAFGYHEEDLIRYTDVVQPDGLFDLTRDNYADAVNDSGEHSNVRVEMKSSGLDGGYLNQGVHHQNSTYFQNFNDMIDDMVESVRLSKPGAADLSMDNYA